MKITEFVKNDNKANFSHFRSGYLYYDVLRQTNNFTSDPEIYQFPVCIQDLDGATVYEEMKAITLMRYIRKAMKDGTLIKH
jgi:hypothetical protein